MRWDEMKCGVWSASLKCGVRGVKSPVRSVKKVFAWRRCIAPGPRADHVLGQQHGNSFEKNAHTRAWLAHSARKFYRWERSYNITLRQLPPRLVRVLLVHQWIQCEVHQLKTVNFWSMVMWWWWIVGARLVGKWVINGSKRCVKWVTPSYTCIIPMLFETWSTHW